MDIHPTVWMDLKNIVLIEEGKTQNKIYSTVSFYVNYKFMYTEWQYMF